MTEFRQSAENLEPENKRTHPSLGMTSDLFLKHLFGQKIWRTLFTVHTSTSVNQEGVNEKIIPGQKRTLTCNINYNSMNFMVFSSKDSY